MNFDLLMRVARWPLEHNFAAVKHTPVKKPVEVERLLAPWLRAAETQSGLDSLEPVGLQVTGGGGGQWRLLTRDGDLVGAESGLSSNGIPGYYLNSDTLAMLADSRTTIEQALCAGRLMIEGPPDVQPRLIHILKSVVAGRGSA